MKKLSVLIFAGLMSLSLVSIAGTRAAANQTQPSGSTITSEGFATAVRNGTDQSVIFVGRTDDGAYNVEVVVNVDGQAVVYPAVASIDGGVITVTFEDGSTTTFDA